MQNGYADIIIEHQKGDSIRDITEIVTGVSLSGDVNRAFRDLSISLMNTLDGRSRRIRFENGDKIRFFNHDKELFRGRIFSFDVNHEGAETLTVYDTNVYLNKSQIDRRFINSKATDIIRNISREIGITPGTIADTGYVIPKLVAEADTVYTTFMDALEITKKQNGRTFHLFNDKGRLSLAERKDRIAPVVIEAGVNLLSANYSQSIEDLRNRLIMKGGENDEFREVRINRDLIEKFGLMQAIEDYNGDDATASEVKQAADQRFKELTTIDDEAKVSALGVNGINCGMAVYVIDEMTGILGAYYITHDSHTFSNGMHQMRLTLTATDDLPKLQIK